MKRALPSVALLLLLAGCGGGSSQPTAQVSLRVSVSIFPSAQQNIDQGQSVSFTASVANDSDSQGVSWNLSGTGCTGSACGALTNVTATGAKYNAPASVSGTLNVSVTARSVKDTSVSRATAVAVAPAPSITTTSLPGGVPGTAYQATLQSTGGTGVHSWSISAGNLPDGLALDASSGEVSGMPSSGGTWNFTAQVTDSAASPLSAQKQLSITIERRTLVVATTSLPDGTQGVAYSATLQANNAVLPVVWSISAGSLPAGLMLNTSSGLISGTPTATGTTTFTVMVTDSSTPAQNASQQLSVTIDPGGPENGLMSGHYAFLLSGYDAHNGPVAVAGSFFADGSGGIQNGVEDINSFASGPALKLTFNGTYAVGADSRGTITLTNSQSKTFTMAVALSAVSAGIATKGALLEFDSSGYTMSGVINRQDSSSLFKALPNSSYAFRLTGSDSTRDRLAMVGKFAADGFGGITQGLFDANDNGVITSSGNFTGAYPAIDLATGRGQASLAGVLPAPPDYALYYVSAAKWLAISLNSPIASGMVTGEVDAQSGGPFGLSSLSGTSVMNLAAPSSSAGSRVMLGLAAFDGSGALTLSLDVNDASATSTLNASGTCAVDSTGRFVLSPQGRSEQVGYLTMANQAFILDTGPEAGAGVLEAQTAGPFSDSSLGADFFFGVQPFAAPPVPPPLGGLTAALSAGIMAFDGGGNLSITSDINQLGALLSGQTIEDTFSASSNGRVTLGSGTMILYIVSPSKILFMTTNLKDPNPTLGSAEH